MPTPGRSGGAFGFVLTGSNFTLKSRRVPAAVASELLKGTVCSAPKAVTRSVALNSFVGSV